MASILTQTADTMQTSTSGKKSFYRSANPFEQKVGYFRAIRKGPFIYTSGTTALKDAQSQASSGSTEVGSSEENASKVLYPKDARKQASVAFERCVNAIEKLGGKREDVVRVKMFVSRFQDCEAATEAFTESFSNNVHGGEVGATATLIVVRDGFVDPDILVEVEVDAVVL